MRLQCLHKRTLHRLPLNTITWTTYILHTNITMFINLYSNIMYEFQLYNNMQQRAAEECVYLSMDAFMSTNYSWLNAHTQPMSLQLSTLNYIWTPEDMCQMKVSLLLSLFSRIHPFFSLKRCPELSLPPSQGRHGKCSLLFIFICSSILPCFHSHLRSSITLSVLPPLLGCQISLHEEHS